MEANKYLRIGLWLFQWLFLPALLGVILEGQSIKGIVLDCVLIRGGSWKLQGSVIVPAHPFFSLYQFLVLWKSACPLFCPCWVEKWGRAEWDACPHGSARSRHLPPSSAFFFFFQEKRYLDPNDLKNCSNAPFDSARIITALICDPSSHPYLLHGRNLDLTSAVLCHQTWED